MNCAASSPFLLDSATCVSRSRRAFASSVASASALSCSRCRDCRSSAVALSAACLSCAASSPATTSAWKQMPTSAAVTRVAAIQEIANPRRACDGRLTSVGATVIIRCAPRMRLRSRDLAVPMDAVVPIPIALPFAFSPGWTTRKLAANPARKTLD